MTLEDQLKEALAKIEAFDAERIALKGKNDEVIGEKRKLQERLRELEDGEASRKLREMEAELDTLKKGGNTEELQAAYEKRLADAQTAHDERLAQLESALREAEGRANAMIAERDLSAAIAKANIAPPLVEAFTALIQAKGVEVNTSGDAPYAMIEGRKVGDWIADYATSDAGKAFVQAPGNGGGGGSEPDPSAKPAGKKWEDMSLRERTALHKSDPAAAKAAMDKAA